MEQMYVWRGVCARCGGEVSGVMTRPFNVEGKVVCLDCAVYGGGQGDHDSEGGIDGCGMDQAEGGGIREDGAGGDDAPDGGGAGTNKYNR